MYGELPTIPTTEPAAALAPTFAPVPDAPTAPPAPTATPTPTATAPLPDTPTPSPTAAAAPIPANTPEPLPTLVGDSIHSADNPISVEWIVPPAMSSDGFLNLKVRVLDDSLTLYPDGASDGNGLDVTISGPAPIRGATRALLGKFCRP